MEQVKESKVVPMNREQNDGQRMRSISMDYKCPICGGSGWDVFEKDGLSYARECECGIRKSLRVYRKHFRVSDWRIFDRISTDRMNRA